jgi:GNAT superfamily N-acetyltransferase
MSAAAEPKIRALTLKDVDRILEIDAAVTGSPRKTGDNDLWRLIAETTTCYGAEVNGKLVGFTLADVRPWEFGNRAHVGWIVALGVDPEHQKSGIGKRLGEKVLDQFRKLGVTQFKTLVDRRNTQLTQYFQALGFHEGREVVMDMGTR